MHHPVSGRRRAIGGGLRDDHRLDRQFGVNESSPGPASAPSQRRGPPSRSHSTSARFQIRVRTRTRSCGTGRDLGLVGVFDGMGGAGGTVYETPEGRAPARTSPSRIARDVVERRMLTCSNRTGTSTARPPPRGPATARFSRRWRSGCQSSRRRPAVCAPGCCARCRPPWLLIALQRTQPGGAVWAGHVFWAGDFRAYVFDPAGHISSAPTICGTLVTP